MMVRRQFKEETVQFRLSSVAQKRRVLNLPNKTITHHSPVLRYVQGSVSRKSKERCQTAIRLFLKADLLTCF